MIYSSPRPGTVKVDGETFDEKDIIWEIDGIEYTADARQDTRDVQWPIYMAAVIKVKKKGGLAAGEHEVSVAYRCIMSPPSVNSDEAFARQPEHPFTRKMLLV